MDIIITQSFMHNSISGAIENFQILGINHMFLSKVFLFFSIMMRYMKAY